MIELKHKVIRAHASFEAQRTLRRTGEPGFAGEVVGSAGGGYPTMMVHSGVVVQPPGLPLRGSAQASYIGRRRASDINILLNGGSYTLPGYVLLEAGLSTLSFDLLGSARHGVSFALTGKNLLNATGPTAWFLRRGLPHQPPHVLPSDERGHVGPGPASPSKMPSPCGSRRGTSTR
jgi:hypothetical protein